MSLHRHEAQGRHVVLVFPDGEQRIRALCATNDDAWQACRLLDKAHYMNHGQRRYTEAARLIHRATLIDGFEWLGQDKEIGAKRCLLRLWNRAQLGMVAK